MFNLSSLTNKQIEIELQQHGVDGELLHHTSLDADGQGGTDLACLIRTPNGQTDTVFLLEDGTSLQIKRYSEIESAQNDSGWNKYRFANVINRLMTTFPTSPPRQDGLLTRIKEMFLPTIESDPTSDQLKLLREINDIKDPRFLVPLMEIVSHDLKSGRVYTASVIEEVYNGIVSLIPFLRMEELIKLKAYIKSRRLEAQSFHENKSYEVHRGRAERHVKRLKAIGQELDAEIRYRIQHEYPHVPASDPRYISTHYKSALSGLVETPEKVSEGIVQLLWSGEDPKTITSQFVFGAIYAGWRGFLAVPGELLSLVSGGAFGYNGRDLGAETGNTILAAAPSVKFARRFNALRISEPIKTPVFEIVDRTNKTDIIDLTNKIPVEDLTKPPVDTPLGPTEILGTVSPVKQAPNSMSAGGLATYSQISETAWTNICETPKAIADTPSWSPPPKVISSTGELIPKGIIASASEAIPKEPIAFPGIPGAAIIDPRPKDHEGEMIVLPGADMNPQPIGDPKGDSQKIGDTPPSEDQKIFAAGQMKRIPLEDLRGVLSRTEIARLRNGIPVVVWETKDNDTKIKTTFSPQMDGTVLITSELVRENIEPVLSEHTWTILENGLELSVDEVEKTKLNKEIREDVVLKNKGVLDDGTEAIAVSNFYTTKLQILAKSGNKFVEIRQPAVLHARNEIEIYHRNAAYHPMDAGMRKDFASGEGILFRRIEIGTSVDTDFLVYKKGPPPLVELPPDGLVIAGKEFGVTKPLFLYRGNAYITSDSFTDFENREDAWHYSRSIGSKIAIIRYQKKGDQYIIDPWPEEDHTFPAPPEEPHFVRDDHGNVSRIVADNSNGILIVTPPVTNSSQSAQYFAFKNDGKKLHPIGLKEAASQVFHLHEYADPIKAWNDLVTTQKSIPDVSAVPTEIEIDVNNVWAKSDFQKTFPVLLSYLQYKATRNGHPILVRLPDIRYPDVEREFRGAQMIGMDELRNALNFIPKAMWVQVNAITITPVPPLDGAHSVAGAFMEGGNILIAVGDEGLRKPLEKILFHEFGHGFTEDLTTAYKMHLEAAIAAAALEDGIEDTTKDWNEILAEVFEHFEKATPALQRLALNVLLNPEWRPEKKGSGSPTGPTLENEIEIQQNAVERDIDKSVSHAAEISVQRTKPIGIRIDSSGLPLGQIQFRDQAAQMAFTSILETFIRNATEGTLPQKDMKPHVRVVSKVLSDGRIEITIVDKTSKKPVSLDEIGSEAGGNPYIRSVIAKLREAKFGPLWVKHESGETLFRFTIPSREIIAIDMKKTSTLSNQEKKSQARSTLEDYLDEGYIVPVASMDIAIEQLFVEVPGSPDVGSIQEYLRAKRAVERGEIPQLRPSAMDDDLRDIYDKTDIHTKHALLKLYFASFRPFRQLEIMIRLLKGTTAIQDITVVDNAPGGIAETALALAHLGVKKVIVKEPNSANHRRTVDEATQEIKDRIEYPENIDDVTPAHVSLWTNLSPAGLFIGGREVEDANVIGKHIRRDVDPGWYLVVQEDFATHGELDPNEWDTIYEGRPADLLRSHGDFSRAHDIERGMESLLPTIYAELNLLILRRKPKDL